MPRYKNYGDHNRTPPEHVLRILRSMYQADQAEAGMLVVEHPQL